MFLSEPEPGGHVLGIAGGKGGCGKTTTAIGLARRLVAGGHSPVIVDCDTDMPDLHRYTGTDRSPNADALADGDPISSTLQRSTTVPGVGVIPAGSPGRLGEALRRVEGWHGPVLLDCPAGAGPDAVDPLRHADRTLLVSTDDPQCLEDTARTGAIATRVNARPYGTVVRTRADSGPSVVGERRVLARMPTVEGDPFSDARLIDTWQSLIDTVVHEDSKGVETPRRTPDRRV